MSSRRACFDLTRHLPHGAGAHAVAMHRQSPAGPRHSGFAVSEHGARIRYIRLDGNGDWTWTTSRRDAELFLTQANADRWIDRNLSQGAAKAVELTA